MSDLHVRNWEKFQHYKDRDPTWIKVYPALLSDDAFLSLTPPRRSLLLCIWLEYARSGRSLPLDTRSLTRRFSQRVAIADLETLNHAGFIEFSASAPPLVLASPEKRREQEPLTSNVVEDQKLATNARDLAA